MAPDLPQSESYYIIFNQLPVKGLAGKKRGFPPRRRGCRLEKASATQTQTKDYTMASTKLTVRQRFRAFMRELAWSILTFFDALLGRPIDSSRLPDTIDDPIPPKKPHP